MKVINRETGNNAIFEDTTIGCDYVTYQFDTGHEFRQYDNGVYFAYTPKGNYAKQPTAHKLIRLASEFEDRRMQVEA